MSDSRLWNTLTGGAHPYGLIPCTELKGESFEGRTVVKCADDLYFAGGGSGCRLYDRKGGRFLDPGEIAETAGMEGFETELSFAPDRILKAVFADGEMRLDGESFPVRIYEAAEKFYLVVPEESADRILVDASRFLLYAWVTGEFIGGYLEV